MVVGGFSSGDEPDGSGKFIANVLSNPQVNEAVPVSYTHLDVYKRQAISVTYCYLLSYTLFYFAVTKL